jgi:hypothetical protein
MKNGGIIEPVNGFKRIKRAQAGLLAGPSSGYLQQLMSMMNLGNQTSSTALDYMLASGQINPGVFGQTDPSVVRSMLPGGPTLEMQRFGESQRQFDVGNALQRELQASQLSNQTGIANIQAGVGHESNRVQSELGNKRISLDKLLGTQSNQLQARNMLNQRSTRQLTAPQGQVVPSMAPILGRGQI